MPPPFIVLVIPGFALFFLVQMLLCEAYHFHVTITRHKKYARGGAAVKSLTYKGKTQTQKELEDSGQYYNNPDSKSNNPTNKSDSSSAESVSHISEDQLKSRRKSVFAESYDPSADDDYEKIVHPKTPEEKQWLMDNLTNITIFQHLAPDQIMTVVDAMYKQPVKNGDYIMKQGDKGNIFYVIQSGVFNVIVTDNNGKEKLMHTYNNKGSFGELALLYNQPRAATIVATSDGCLWAVDGQTFRRIVHKITYEKRQMYETLIKNVPMLKQLEPFECSNLVDALVPKTCQDKQVIITQGEEADGMYFIIEGAVTLEVKTDSGKNVFLKNLKAGDYFGELGLIANKPRAVTVSSNGTTHLAFLDREAFERLLGPCMDIMKRNISSYNEEMDKRIQEDALK